MVKIVEAGVYLYNVVVYLYNVVYLYTAFTLTRHSCVPRYAASLLIRQVYLN